MEHIERVNRRSSCTGGVERTLPRYEHPKITTGAFLAGRRRKLSAFLFRQFSSLSYRSPRPSHYSHEEKKNTNLRRLIPTDAARDCFEYSKSSWLRTVITYASPAFAHAAPNRLKKLQILQNKFCRSATYAHRCVKNSVLHRDLDLLSITKYTKNASERLFSIAESNSNPLLSATVSYEAPPPYRFIRRPRNIVNNPPEDFTAEIERLIEITKQNNN
ncbi:hypothetical protein EVAR_54597_1 [Eumeta japonica]|uniref:Uncharacterized protein n=1 Tax=Eumeta variegata TaxID=151549 RepID=A0A4C1YKB8_EUMVA|nr:hypothetical protein EVAR_54597_1 [Eumeta japonica]